MAHTEGPPGISPEVVSWRASAGSVRVHYQIAKPKSDDLHCSVVAYAPSHAEVGRAEVIVPPGTCSTSTEGDVIQSDIRGRLRLPHRLKPCPQWGTNKNVIPTQSSLVLATSRLNAGSLESSTATLHVNEEYS